MDTISQSIKDLNDKLKGKKPEKFGVDKLEEIFGYKEKK